MSIAESLISKPPHLREDVQGVLRVADSRVSLETVLGEFNDGASAEEIVAAYDTVSLADVYAVIAYYLANRSVVDAYIEHAEREGDSIQRQMEKCSPADGLRDRLLARGLHGAAL